ncbi:MAG: DUF192 domain-containing protein [Candidatus Magasanikbacteria bacterium]|nr:DUF192 domain-containing protein [Candidatus Magasanikbacteria bacterium]
MSNNAKFKKWHLYLFGIIVLIFVVLKLYDWLYWPKAEALIAGHEISVLVADTATHWHKGLSGRDGLKENEGMWFKMNSLGYYTMVMRDMEFSIDIVWIDEGKIVDIAPGLKPEKDRPEALLTSYRPRLPATAVLELPAGFIARNGIKIGDTAVFKP